jgi:hypothetical protein
MALGAGENVLRKRWRRNRVDDSFIRAAFVLAGTFFLDDEIAMPVEKLFYLSR